MSNHHWINLSNPRKKTKKASNDCYHHEELGAKWKIFVSVSHLVRVSFYEIWIKDNDIILLIKKACKDNLHLSIILTIFDHFGTTGNDFQVCLFICQNINEYDEILIQNIFLRRLNEWKCSLHKIKLFKKNNAFRSDFKFFARHVIGCDWSGHNLLWSIQIVMT